MGMTYNQLRLVMAVAEGKLEEAKRCAIACCNEDTTRKNQHAIERCKNILSASNKELKLPADINGMAVLEDVSDFREDRYYLSDREQKLFSKIENINRASIGLMELSIPYLNAILLTGESGTGKTMFGRYVAYKLNLPFLYINFSYLIDSYMGKTGQNLRRVFAFARENKCLLMLDEIDAIAQQRKGAAEGANREYNNCTITLLQELDRIKNDTIVIGATNMPDSIDQAVKRRFVLHHEIQKMSVEENCEMIDAYLNTIGLSYNRKNIKEFCEANRRQTQAFLINKTIQSIADSLINNKKDIILR